MAREKPRTGTAEKTQKPRSVIRSPQAACTHGHCRAAVSALHSQTPAWRVARRGLCRAPNCPLCRLSFFFSSSSLLGRFCCSERWRSLHHWLPVVNLHFQLSLPLMFKLVAFLLLLADFFRLHLQCPVPLTRPLLCLPHFFLKETM